MLVDDFIEDKERLVTNALKDIKFAGDRRNDLMLLETVYKDWKCLMQSWGFSDFSPENGITWAAISQLGYNDKDDFHFMIYAMPDLQAVFGCMRYMHQFLPGGCFWRTRKGTYELVCEAEWRGITLHIGIGLSTFCEARTEYRKVLVYTCDEKSEEQ